MTGRICGTGSCLPKEIWDNDRLSQMVDTSDEWIRERTGIRQRHIATGDETTVTLAVGAAKAALEDAGISAEEVDLLIVATVSPDDMFPATSCQVQDAIGAVNATCFDLNAACTGFIFALNTAQAYISQGIYRTALLIGAERLSNLTNWEDRTTCILFGDGAGAAVVRVEEDDESETATDFDSSQLTAGVSESGSACEAAGEKESGSAREAVGANETGSACKTAGEKESGSAREAVGANETGSACKTAGEKESGSAREAVGADETGSACKTAGEKESGSAREAVGVKETGSACKTAGEKDSGSACEVIGVKKSGGTERSGKVSGSRRRYAQVTHSEGAKGSALTCASRNQAKYAGVAAPETYLQMDGRAVFKFAITKVPDVILELAEREQIDLAEVKYFVLHQANERIIQGIWKKLRPKILHPAGELQDIPGENRSESEEEYEARFPVNIQETGNTSSASIPILLDRLNKEGKLQRGDKIILAGFGAGLSYGASYMVW